MKEDSREFQKAYREWVLLEKAKAGSSYKLLVSGFKFKETPDQVRGRLDDQKIVTRDALRVTGGRVRVRWGYAVAAVLVVILVTSVVLVKQGVIFERKPVYTQAQIEKSYEGTVKALALCAKSIRQGMGQFKDLQKIPQSIDQIKTLKTAVSEINKENQPIEN